MDFDLTEIFAAFLAESEECLLSLESGLLQLEVQPDDSALIDLIFRAAHTLKGNSSSLGFPELSAFAHEIEDILDGLRKQETRADGSLVTLLLHATDAMRKWIPRLRLDEPNPISDDARPVYEQLCARARGESEGGSTEGGSGRTDDELVRETTAAESTMRVQTSRMDALLNFTGELAIAAERIRARAAAVKGPERASIAEAIEDFDRLLRDVHETVMRSRTVALGPSLRRHRRTVRDLASAQGKQIRLELQGEDVEVDVSVLDALSDPLTHMIRNAVDHGIELPQTRVAAGKRAQGTVTIRAFHERASIVLQIADDGAGIVRANVRERALAMGLEADMLSDDELLSLIFEPGFSTARTVTETSGRGVGMDVVRRNVERVRGRVSVESREGAGTTLTLRLPLTLAVIPGFVVAVSGEMLVIPLSEVDECLSFGGVHRDGTAGVLHVRGEVVPFIRLREHLGFGGTPPGPEVVVVVEHHDGRAAFVVDEVIGESQIVIKPLTAMLRHLPGVAGTAVMPNGSVAMVLEPAAIFKEIERVSAA